MLNRVGCSQHALVIYGNGEGLDLEDLASTGEGVGTELYTRCVMSILTVAWIVLLITVSGVKQQTWFLLAIGSLGMVHTVFVAGQPRRPSAFGIPLTYREFILGDDVMCSLKLLEEKYPRIGLSLLSTFFPSELQSQDEIEYWNNMRKTAKARYKALNQQVGTKAPGIP